MKLNPPYIPTIRHTDETLLLRSRIIAAGSTIATRTCQHIDKFVLDCKNDGVWDRLSDVMPFVGDSLSGAMVKLKFAGASAAATAVNFVAGDYTEATGLLGDGATKYLNLNVAPSNIFTNLGGMASYNREDTTTAAVRYALGVTDATDNYILGSNNGSSHCAAYMGLGIAALPVTPYTKGFYYAERQSSTDLRIYRNNIELGSNVANAGSATPTINYFAFAKNNNGGGATNFLNTRLSFLALTLSMTAPQREAFYNHVQTLQTNLGRAV